MTPKEVTAAMTWLSVRELMSTAEQRKAEQRTVSRTEIDRTENGQNQRVQTDDTDGNQKYSKHCKILCKDNLRNADRKGVQKLVRLGVTFFRNRAHRQDRNDQKEYNRDIGQDIFKRRIGRDQVDQRCENTGNRQHKANKDVARHVDKVVFQFFSVNC